METKILEGEKWAFNMYIMFSKRQNYVWKYQESEWDFYAFITTAPDRSNLSASRYSRFIEVNISRYQMDTFKGRISSK